MGRSIVDRRILVSGGDGGFWIAVLADGSTNVPIYHLKEYYHSLEAALKELR